MLWKRIQQELYSFALSNEKTKSMDKNKAGFYYLMTIMAIAFVLLIVMLVRAYLG